MDSPLKRRTMLNVRLLERMSSLMMLSNEYTEGTSLVTRSIPFLHYKDTRGAFDVTRDMEMNPVAVALFDTIPERPDEGSVLVVYNGYNEPYGEETWEAVKAALGTDSGVVTHTRFKNTTLESVAAEISQYANQPTKSEMNMSRPLTPLEVQDIFLTEVANIAEEYANDEDLTVSQKCHGVAFSVLATIDGSRGSSPMQLVALPPEAAKQVCIEQGEDFIQPGTIINPEFNLHTRYDLIRKDVMSGMPDDGENAEQDSETVSGVPAESLLDDADEDLPF